MRVISGKYKGLKLICSSNSKTRPITSYAKGRLFSILDSKIEGKKVLDLYAGTGSIGIEALSRGCGHVTFVEKNYSAFSAIKSNLNKCNEITKVRAVHEDVISFVKRNNELFDLIFSTPPYQEKYYSDFLKLIDKKIHLLNNNGTVIIESNIHSVNDFSVNNIYKWKELVCDDTIFEFWMKK